MKVWTVTNGFGIVLGVFIEKSLAILWINSHIDENVVDFYLERCINEYDVYMD